MRWPRLFSRQRSPPPEDSSPELTSGQTTSRSGDKPGSFSHLHDFWEEFTFFGVDPNDRPVQEPPIIYGRWFNRGKPVGLKDGTEYNVLVSAKPMITWKNITEAKFFAYITPESQKVVLRDLKERAEVVHLLILRGVEEKLWRKVTTKLNTAKLQRLEVTMFPKDEPAPEGFRTMLSVFGTKVKGVQTDKNGLTMVPDSLVLEKFLLRMSTHFDERQEEAPLDLVALLRLNTTILIIDGQIDKFKMKLDGLDHTQQNPHIQRIEYRAEGTEFRELIELIKGFRRILPGLNAVNFGTLKARKVDVLPSQKNVVEQIKRAFNTLKSQIDRLLDYCQTNSIDLTVEIGFEATFRIKFLSWTTDILESFPPDTEHVGEAVLSFCGKGEAECQDYVYRQAGVK
ncbi:unnamed protein product [Bursaphelenchus xylophilus]|nr:unnamed protein product [Bursaphelenchus xylophilus]CAG9087111.1 unnamed protein product [Bursaphelenchus xylophilus]